MSFSELSHHVIGCAIEVHRTLGPNNSFIFMLFMAFMAFMVNPIAT